MEEYKLKTYLEEEFINKRRSSINIAKDFGVPYKNVEYYIKKHKLNLIKGKVKYVCNIVRFSLEDPIFNYYAGLVATDGYIDLKNNRVNLRVGNDGSEEVLSNIKTYFEFSGPVHSYVKKSSGKVFYELSITSTFLIKQLSKMNIDGLDKTFNLGFPRKFHSDECAKMFLRGCLDGDGNIKIRRSKLGRINGGEFRLTTASYDFIQGLITFINKKFKRGYIVTHTRTRGIKYPQIQLRKIDSLNFYNWVYDGFDNFRFHDKYNKYLLLIGQ